MRFGRLGRIAFGLAAAAFLIISTPLQPVGAQDRSPNSISLSVIVVDSAGTGEQVLARLKNGDDFAAMMMERTGKYIGAAIASVINLLNPECIVLGGGVMEAGEFILDPIIKEAQRRAFQPCFEATKIITATLGLDAIAIGAALLALDTLQSV